jgi:hypothetical protein
MIESRFAVSVTEQPSKWIGTKTCRGIAVACGDKLCQRISAPAGGGGVEPFLRGAVVGLRRQSSARPRHITFDRKRKLSVEDDNRPGREEGDEIPRVEEHDAPSGDEDVELRPVLGEKFLRWIVQ